MLKNKTTNESLNLFFLDLEPAENKKEMYNINGLQNNIIQIQPPRANKKNIIQGMRGQQYGHSKSHCKKSFLMR